MVDVNEVIQDKGSLSDFCLENDLVNYVCLLNPELIKDPAYLYNRRRIDYILVFSNVVAKSIIARHHQFD